MSIWQNDKTTTELRTGSGFINRNNFHLSYVPSAIVSTQRGRVVDKSALNIYKSIKIARITKALA